MFKLERNPDGFTLIYKAKAISSNETIFHQVHQVRKMVNKRWQVFAPTTSHHPDLYRWNVLQLQYPVSSPIRASPQETLSHLKNFAQSLLSFSPCLCLSLPQFHFLASFSHLLSKLTNEEDKEWGAGGRQREEVRWGKRAR